MVDQVARAPRLPAAGETLIGSAFAVCCGGKGSNQAVMAARLGADVTMVVKLGRDALGERTLENYRDQGIRTDFVLFDDELPSGVALIWVNEQTGQNSIICVPGANLALTPADVHSAAATITASSVVVCQNEVPLVASRAALALAKGAGVRTIYNPAPAADVTDELLELCDVVAPNETEAAFMTGVRTATDDGAAEAADSLRRRGARAVVLTLGQRGALVLDDSGLTHIAARSVRAVDTTGAGDALVGSLAFYLARGDSLHEAAQKSCLVATQSVLKPGTQTSFPYPHELPEICR
jgi:ribokinase